MLTIRLQRGGKRNTAQYKVVLAQKTAANQKQFVEILGSYNPHTKELGIRNQERLDYWMNEQHVPLSETVHNLFVTKEIIKADKVKAFTLPKKEVAAAEPAADSAESDSEAPAEEAAAETAEVLAEAETPADAPAETEAPAEAAPEEVPAPEAPADAEPVAPEASAEPET